MSALTCPICKRPISLSNTGSADDATRWRPFCSERCKLVDLGAWLDGAYRIGRPIEEEDLDQGTGGASVGEGNEN